MIHIKTQGAPVINTAMTLVNTPDVIVVELDMRTKYCEVGSSSGNEVNIYCTDAARHWHGQCKDLPTTVELETEGFMFLGQGGGRYTLNLIFIRKDIYDMELPVQWFDDVEIGDN